MQLKILRCHGGRRIRNRQTLAHCGEYQVISQKDKGMATKEKKMHLCSAARELNLNIPNEEYCLWPSVPPSCWLHVQSHLTTVQSARDHKNVADKQCYLQL